MSWKIGHATNLITTSLATSATVAATAAAAAVVVAVEYAGVESVCCESSLCFAKFRTYLDACSARFRCCQVCCRVSVRADLNEYQHLL